MPSEPPAGYDRVLLGMSRCRSMLSAVAYGRLQHLPCVNATAVIAMLWIVESCQPQCKGYAKRVCRREILAKLIPIRKVGVDENIAGRYSPTQG